MGSGGRIIVRFIIRDDRDHQGCNRNSRHQQSGAKQHVRTIITAATVLSAGTVFTQNQNTLGFRRRGGCFFRPQTIDPFCRSRAHKIDSGFQVCDRKSTIPRPVANAGWQEAGPWIIDDLGWRLQKGDWMVSNLELASRKVRPSQCVSLWVAAMRARHCALGLACQRKCARGRACAPARPVRARARACVRVCAYTHTHDAHACASV